MDILSKIYPVAGGPRIDMWKMTSASHTFGYWTDGSKASPICPPEKEVEIPIEYPAGMYPGNPSIDEFHNWMGEVRQNPERFTYEDYIQTFCEKE